MRLLRPLVGLVAVAALLGASCGRQAPVDATTKPAALGNTSAPLSGTVSVAIENFVYSPATLVVKKGTIIEVTNKDLSGHSLTADDGSFDTDILGKGQKKTLTMTAAGTFKVHCTPHPSITGTITVVE